MKRNYILSLMIIGIIFGTFIFNNAFNWNPNENQLKTKNNFTSSDSNIEKADVISKNYILGSGNNVRTGLYTNISSKVSLTVPFLEEPGFKYFDLPINTHNQNITQANLTFLDIEAITTLQTIDGTPEDYLSYELPYWYAMSFKISTPVKLRQLQLFVQETNQTAPPYWNIEIYNATRLLDASIILDKFTGINISQRVIGPQAAHWHNFTFTDVQLNMSNTCIDAKGFAYYFFKIIMPPKVSGSDLRFLYISYDRPDKDNGLCYYVSDLVFLDICMKVEIAPLSSNPVPTEVQLAVKNLNRPPLVNLTVETNHTLPLRTITNWLRLESQNFNLTDYGTIHNISLYIKSTADIGKKVYLAIFPTNYTGVGPMLDGNLLYDYSLAENIPNGFEGWYTFSMRELPNLNPGEYWWVLYTPDSNITLYGAEDPIDDAVALDIILTSIFNFYVIDYDFADIIGVQYGKESFNVSASWIANDHIVPDTFSYYHYTIITRWLGITHLNVSYCIELESVKYSQSNYYSIFESQEVLWNLSVQATFLPTGLGKIINLTVPRDWSIRNVTRNGIDHGKNNWTVYQQQGYCVLSIYNCSDGDWLFWCNSTMYQVDYAIEKRIGGLFQPTLNATVYDRLRVNINITNQRNGICSLAILYPDNKTIFINTTEITMSNTILSWYPENDSAATGGQYTFGVFWSNGTELGYNRRYFSFTSIPTNLNLVSSVPLIYTNDITKTLLVRYNDSRGVNIVGATIWANLNGIPLEWEDAYSKSLNPEDRGLYRIKLNTTGLNANQSYPLIINAQKYGFENFSLPLQQIWVSPVPSALITNVKNITQYKNQVISFSCSFKDTFHGIGIDWASITYTIVGTPINGNMTSIMPGESVYIATNVQLYNFIGRTDPYQINISAHALNCEAASVILDLYVLNKTDPLLTVTIPAGPFIQGQSLQIEAKFLNGSAPYVGIPNATIIFSFEGVIPQRIALTDLNGIARIEIAIPGESFSITAFFDEAFSINGKVATPVTISVLSYANLALWIGIIAAVCVVSVLTVRQAYIVPKRKSKLQRYQRIANKFQDIANLRQIMILYKDSGTCIFQESLGGELDGDLISGFLTAISSFQVELKPKKSIVETPESAGFELNYQDYKILLFEGALIRMAFMLEKTPTEEFRKSMHSFIGEYEESFHQALMGWRGDVGPFKESSQFIAKKLETTLLWPHQLRKPAASEKITSLEDAVIKIADTIMKSQVTKYFFLPAVISMGQAVAPQSKMEIYAAVYNLRYRDIFIPVDPSSLKS